MKRKTLKQKLKSQLRAANEMREVEFHQAGLTINYETQAMQAISMAHGVMATLILVKNTLGEDHEHYKAIEEPSQARIAQCLMALVAMGMDVSVANARITQGH